MGALEPNVVLWVTGMVTDSASESELAAVIWEEMVESGWDPGLVKVGPRGHGAPRVDATAQSVAAQFAAAGKIQLDAGGPNDLGWCLVLRTLMTRVSPE